MSNPNDRPSGRASVPSTPSGGRSGSTGGRARPPVNGGRGGGGTTYGQAPKPKKTIKPKWGRIALVAAVALLIFGGAVFGGIMLYSKNLDDKLTKVDPFSSIVGDRPLKTVDGAFNILLVGSDSRDPDAKPDAASQWRADTIVIVHIPADHQKAYLTSIPRDLRVHVPKSQTSPYGDTMAKINASFSWGGLPLAVQTVEEYTGVRIDHVVSIDFGGLKEVVDALGGVDMKVDKTIKSIHKPFRTYEKGTRHFNGAEALDYVRQRYQFADGDFARMKHQQMLLRALMDKAADSATLTDIGKLNNFLQTLTKAVTVDKDFSLADMVIQFRGLRSDKITFLTSPNVGSQTIDGESFVVGDKNKALAFYDAMGKDQLDAYFAAHPTATPSATQ
ncbi:LCP family protein required for cell wall assembly [Allocatelliglobosispora scoriae]|uniref:LCP family protein required for cell wall assembly n=1 Tax=Allocatelliglobosispora scoriae TaxID=643052 RepID=A0A841BVS9_9ACTN|nr:LCP family protein [Allocatelliglobosispora scoriae]MBB5870860.1 LCP family protein required for cell wall assembly [Allocatelliglobosispora scoriae]